MSATVSMPSTFNAAVAGKRKQRDVAKLLMSDYKVTQSSNNKSDMVVEFEGPKDSIYEGGLWKVHVLLPDQYPYKSPSIGFLNKIFHPNVDEASGSVCLDVINQTWSPMFELVNIFDNFLPQLLNYPNPSDPLNSEAASLMNKNYKRYETKVRDYVKRYASLADPFNALSQPSPSLLPQIPQLLDKNLLSDRLTSTCTSSRRESQEMEDETTTQASRKLSRDISMKSDGLFCDSILEKQCSKRKGDNDDDDDDDDDDEEDNLEEVLSAISVEDLSELSENGDIDQDAIACFA